MPEEALTKIAEQAPWAAAMLIMSMVYTAIIWKIISASNTSRDKTEAQHAKDRLHTLGQLELVSVEFRAALNRASTAVEKLAESESLMAASISGMNAKLDTIMNVANTAQARQQARFDKLEVSETAMVAGLSGVNAKLDTFIQIANRTPKQ